MDGPTLARDMARATVALVLTVAMFAAGIGALTGYLILGCEYAIKIEKVEVENGDD